jgi:porphobilinogen synthase
MYSSYPEKRMHRVRKTPSIRELFTETRLHPSDFIMPVFIKEGITTPVEVPSMPGIFQHSIESAKHHIDFLISIGVHAILLFGIPLEKDPLGQSAYAPVGVVQQAISTFKKEFPTLTIMADCCLCEYTSHGHCGVMTENGLDNDATLTILQKTALSYAESGVDVVAPSGMMDGMIKALRTALDSKQFYNTALMAYSAKYASAFYGPFRDAAGSEGFSGNRKHHQMNPSQKKEAYQEALLDVQESADIVMVKPALAYLDIIHHLSQCLPVPVAAYQVSGEYSMIKLAAMHGLLDEKQAVLETLTSIKRAGANMIISYFAQDIRTIL